jgi:superfamily II DNA or RNA helicase
MNRLLSHQEAELAFLDRNERAFLFSETGTGKTPVLLAYSARILGAGGRVLWLTEAGLVDQLREEARRWLPADLPQPERGSGRVLGSARFLVVSHQWAARNKDALLGARWDLVVVDEADVVASGAIEPSSATCHAVRACVDASTRSVLATATPVATTHGLDLYALLEAGKAPKLLPRPAFQALVRYVLHDNGYGGTRRVPRALTQEGLTHLQQVVSACSVATRLVDIGRDLPQVKRTHCQVALTAQQKAASDQAQRQATGLERHRLSTRASISPHNLGKAALETIRHLKTTGHTRFILFAEELATLEGVEKQLAPHSVRYWHITGDTPAKARAQAIQAHRESGGVLLGTRALETGLNLQHASCLISVVPTWSHSRELQREGRIRRLGSPHSVVEHVIITSQSPLEVAKARRLQSKANLLDAVMSAVPTAHDMDAVEHAATS